ncbi:MAG: sulfatase [Patescibacteria group bacterium]|nr:sulfatase [Patescibacteria group bacterium]
MSAKTAQIWFSVLILVVVVAIGAYVLSRPSASLAPAPFGCANCNVIIVGMDAMRADHIHALGYPLETTPNLDALIAHSYTFTNAISASNWTVPGFMSIFTGVFPSIHKVVNKYVTYTPTSQILSNLQQLSPNIDTLAQSMKANGYATGGFTGDAGVNHVFGDGAGFDVYTDNITFGDLANSDTHATAWLDSLQKGQKFFMFYHGYDMHGMNYLPPAERIFVPKNYTGPYDGSPAEEAKLREQQLLPGGIHLTPQDVAFWTGLYDSKVHEADAEFGNFLNQLKARGLLKNTIIVILADHGEEIYDHGGIDHGQSLYDELIHVPLIVSIPNAPGGVQISGQVTTMDIGKAILNLVGATPNAAFASQTAGRPNLVTYLEDPSKPGYTVYVETDYRDYTHERSIRTPDGWTYILTLESGKEELYNLNTDPTEHTNLIGNPVDQTEAEKLRTALRAHLTDDLHTDLSKPMSTGCLPVYDGECQ